MKITKTLLKGGVKQTGKVMHALVRAYHTDMIPVGSHPLAQAFDFIKKLPFTPDPPGDELVQRPLYTLRSGGDCDDKAICMASYAVLNGLEYRFRAVGVKKNPRIARIPLTHVWTEIKISSESGSAPDWIICDCTYAFNTLGQRTVDYDRSEII